MRRRFFVDHFEANSAVLRGDSADHLGRVLRAQRGQLYELSDSERVWLSKVERIALAKHGASRIDFSLVEPVLAIAPRLQIDLLLSIVKFERFEWCLEKATELNATSIIPLSAARTDKPLISAAKKRQERWKKILLESAQQSRRLKPPTLHELRTPEAAFWQSRQDLKIVLSERRESPSIRAALLKNSPLGGLSFSFDNTPAAKEGDLAPDGSRSASICLAIGPEGGWTDYEIAAAGSAGFTEASLSENILRTETAVLAAMAIVGFALGQ